MAATRTLLLKTGVIARHRHGLADRHHAPASPARSLIWRAALAVHANFLFERPDAFWIAPKKPGAVLQAAE